MGWPTTFVGCAGSELEFRRYARRQALTNLLSDCDAIQVIAGSPAWALPVLGLGKPVSLQVATRVRIERRLRDAHLTSVLALWRRSMTRVTDRLETRALRSVQALQVENAWMYEEVRRLNSDRAGIDIRLAPPGVDAATFKPADPTPGRGRYLLSVGRFSDPRKNIELLLDAFVPLAAEFSDLKLVTAGSSSPPDAYWAKVALHGLGQRVRHVLSPSRSALVSLYQQATLFALVSDEEGLGIVLLEAMACGIPVVSTRSGGPDGLITPFHDGVLVPRGDVKALTESVRALLQDPAHLAQMGTQARRSIEERYASEVAGRDFMDVWRRLVPTPGP